MTAAALTPTAARADRIFFRWIFPALLIGIFVIYATFRQRYVGATDWYGYYQQGELLKTGRVFLPTAFPCDQFPAIVPFGYVVAGRHAVPQYTPGFPLLLALGRRRVPRKGGRRRGPAGDRARGQRAGEHEVVGRLQRAA